MNDGQTSAVHVSGIQGGVQTHKWTEKQITCLGTNRLRWLKLRATSGTSEENVSYSIKTYKVKTPGSHGAVQPDKSDKWKMSSWALWLSMIVFFQWSSLICVVIASNRVRHLPLCNLFSRAQLTIIQTFIAETISLRKLLIFTRHELSQGETCGTWLDCGSSKMSLLISPLQIPAD